MTGLDTYHEIRTGVQCAEDTSRASGLIAQWLLARGIMRRYLGLCVRDASIGSGMPVPASRLDFTRLSMSCQTTGKS